MLMKSARGSLLLGHSVCDTFYSTLLIFGWFQFRPK